MAPPLAEALAPKLSQLGGGIDRKQVGAKTASYVEYFGDAADDAANAQLTKKRVENYTDVVNSCARPAAARGGALRSRQGSRRMRSVERPRRAARSDAR